MKKTDSSNFGLINVTCILILLTLSIFILKELESILLPLFVALLISFVFLPVYNYLNNKKLPAFLSLGIVILIILILANIVSVFIYTSINSFSSEFPLYEQKFLHIYNDFIPKLNLTPEEETQLEQFFNIKKLFASGNLTTAISGILTSITALLGNFVLIIFYIIFIITESESIGKRFSLAYSEERNTSLRNTLGHIVIGLRDYISGKTLLSLMQAILIGTILWICGVDFYVVWAFLFFFTDFIPNIGSLFASIFLGLFMALQFEAIIYPLVIIIILIVIQNLKGNVIEPKFFGSKLDLSPFLLFFSLVFWGYIWGILGMILSVPIMSMLKIILMNIPSTKPIAILMSNNPEKTIFNKK